MNNKGQLQNGLITGLVFGVASLIIGVIIAFVIVSTLTDANLLERSTLTITNETGFVNSTGDTLDAAAYSGFVSDSITITYAYNYTSGVPITPITGNITVSAAGVVTNASSLSWLNTSLTYTYILKGKEEVTSDSLSVNFTEGVSKISAKIPTVLLVAAIVLILGVLAILVGVWQRMRMSGTSI